MRVVVVVLDDVVVSDLMPPRAVRDGDGDPGLQSARKAKARTTATRGARFIVGFLPRPGGP
jgi:hypothetical protein